VVVDCTGDGSDLKLFQADKIDEFQPPVLRLEDPEKPLGNFLFINESALLFDEKTSQALGNFIEAAGQIFKIDVEGIGKRYLLNVLETCNPVDKKNSVVDPTNWRHTLTQGTLRFHKSRVFSYSSVFKIPDLQYIPIVSFNVYREHEHDFYAVYKAHDLTGLVFDEVWRSED